MFKKILNNYKNFDKTIVKILKKGLQFCFVLCIISTVILFTYNLSNHSIFMYNLGMGLFRLSLTFGAEFVICSFITDGIKKQLI